MSKVELLDVTEEDVELLEEAEKAREQAYEPYSEYDVGAAVRTKDGNVFRGVNMENINFSGTIHAEGNAISSAIAEGYGPGDFESLAVSCADPVWPCGRCRQTISEIVQEKEGVRIIKPSEDGSREADVTYIENILPGSMENI